MTRITREIHTDGDGPDKRRYHMELEKLRYEVRDGIGVITMDYPKNLNAIDERMAMNCCTWWTPAKRIPR